MRVSESEKIPSCAKRSKYHERKEQSAMSEKIKVHVDKSKYSL